MDPDNIYDGVHAFQHDGTLEWHTFIENCQGPIAAADVDGDGGVEVAVGAWTTTYVLDENGDILDSISGVFISLSSYQLRMIEGNLFFSSLSTTVSIGFEARFHMW